MANKVTIQKRLNNIAASIVHVYESYRLYDGRVPKIDDVKLLTSELVTKDIVRGTLPDSIEKYIIDVTEQLNRKPIIKIKYVR